MNVVLSDLGYFTELQDYRVGWFKSLWLNRDLNQLIFFIKIIDLNKYSLFFKIKGKSKLF